MSNLYLFWIAGIIFSQVWSINSQCEVVTGLSGKVSFFDGYNTKSVFQKCWTITVGTHQFIQLNLQELYKPDYLDCDVHYLRITANETNRTLCPKYHYSPFTVNSSVTILIYSKATSNRRVSFELNFTIQGIECMDQNTFRCSNHSCIPKEQACDGVKHCENGADEDGCEIPYARTKAIGWLKSKRTLSWGWRDLTPRAITALFLADNSNLKPTNLEAELMAKQNELKAAEFLLSNTTSIEQLSMFINALTATCHNPRHFCGHNLVKLLKDQMESTNNHVHPIAYLALCIANETWPGRSAKDLVLVLKSNPNFLFSKDMEAFAVIAVSCSTNNLNVNNNSETLQLVHNRTLTKFMSLQMEDGSFGNVPTTSLITQALISSSQNHTKHWNLDKVMAYLIGELNSSNVEFFDIYLTLPLLNGKTFLNITNLNCSANPRNHKKEDIVIDIDDHKGPKIYVKYSIYVGDLSDVFYSVTFRVPNTFSAFQMMQLAAAQDPRFKFEWKRIHNKLYIYKIGKVSNDPEGGKFWVLCLGMADESVENNCNIGKSADAIPLVDGNHVFMKYGKTQIYEV